MKHVILAHGILGFGAQFFPTPVHYFNGVASHLRNHGHHVIEPTVNPIASIKDRGNRLGEIVTGTPLAPHEKWHIIAHSMGGLDVRHALNHVPRFRESVATLVTIGTPHEGSPVADALVRRAGPLFDIFPRFFREPLLNTEGLVDLTTERATAFNLVTPDVAGVRYIAIAGDAARANHGLLLFDVAQLLGDLTHEPNDGVVTRRSALRPGFERFEDWPTDHAGEVGWTHPLLPALDAHGTLVSTPRHFAWYDELVSRL